MTYFQEIKVRRVKNTFSTSSLKALYRFGSNLVWMFIEEVSIKCLMENTFSLVPTYSHLASIINITE